MNVSWLVLLIVAGVLLLVDQGQIAGGVTMMARHGKVRQS
jgi:hypothetical protein